MMCIITQNRNASLNLLLFYTLQMLKVRRTLTEILLEVTTEEMEAVAHEVLSKAKAKGIRYFSYTFTFLLRINRVLSRTF